jgi:hypothetical protein
MPARYRSRYCPKQAVTLLRIRSLSRNNRSAEISYRSSVPRAVASVWCAMPARYRSRYCPKQAVTLLRIRSLSRNNRSAEISYRSLESD